MRLSQRRVRPQSVKKTCRHARLAELTERRFVEREVNDLTLPLSLIDRWYYWRNHHNDGAAFYKQSEEQCWQGEQPTACQQRRKWEWQRSESNRHQSGILFITTLQRSKRRQCWPLHHISFSTLSQQSNSPLISTIIIITSVIIILLLGWRIIINKLTLNYQFTIAQ